MWAGARADCSPRLGRPDLDIPTVARTLPTYRHFRGSTGVPGAGLLGTSARLRMTVPKGIAPMGTRLAGQDL